MKKTETQVTNSINKKLKRIIIILFILFFILIFKHLINLEKSNKYISLPNKKLWYLK